MCLSASISLVTDPTVQHLYAVSYVTTGFKTVATFQVSIPSRGLCQELNNVLMQPNPCLNQGIPVEAYSSSAAQDVACCSFLPAPTWTLRT
jgi:hypothetical protein